MKFALTDNESYLLEASKENSGYLHPACYAAVFAQARSEKKLTYDQYKSCMSRLETKGEIKIWTDMYKDKRITVLETI
jgi:hypothetical protein